MQVDIIRPKERLCLQLAARFSDLSRLAHFIPSVVAQFAEMASDIEVDFIAGDLRLAIHEVCANIIDHAYEGESEQPIVMTMSLNRLRRQIIVRVVDYGRAFNPDQSIWPPPESWHPIGGEEDQYYLLGDVPEQDLEEERGRGLYLLTFLLDVVRYYPKVDENNWYLVKQF